MKYRLGDIIELSGQDRFHDIEYEIIGIARLDTVSYLVRVQSIENFLFQDRIFRLDEGCIQNWKMQHFPLKAFSLLIGERYAWLEEHQMRLSEYTKRINEIKKEIWRM